MKRLLLLLGAVGVCCTLSWAQSAVTHQPRVSQKAMTGQTIGVAEVMVIYHRPAVKEREVWGGLVAYQDAQPWRAGANENTLFKLSHDAQIGGKTLEAGKYGLHVLIPSESSCQVIFSHNTTAWGSYAYNPAEDALRVEAKLKKADRFYEFLTYHFENITETSTDCYLSWGDKSIVFSIDMDVHGQTFASLKSELQTQAGWTWKGWNEAAGYCLRNDVYLQEGLAWASQSVFMNPNPSNMLIKARLTAKVKGASEAETPQIVLETMEKDLNTFPVTWKEWNAAANYSLQQATNLEKGLAMSEKSTKMFSDMNNMIVKGQLLSALGKEKEASKVKKLALENATNQQLNNYGYQLLFAGKAKEAVTVFEANAQKHPNDPNVFDSLGEGYMNAGEKEKAIQSFKKSLSMNPPANVKANSLKLLKQLGAEYTPKEAETAKLDK